MHILLTGGGSGGHIFPNIALLRKLKREHSGIKISYIGEQNSMEQTLITQEGVSFYSIKAGKLRRYFSLQNILDIFKVLSGIFKSILLIKKLSPDVIFSKGGYVCLPVVIAAKVLKKRVIIHESDVYPGIATRISSKFASTICVSWQRTLSLFPGKNVVLTGIPVREELKNGSKEKGYAFTGIEKNNLPTILVVGGSLGAGSINNFLKENASSLLMQYNIIHLVGKGKAFFLSLDEDIRKRYVQLEFVGEEMADIFALTDVAISRAGSTALAEFIYLQKPVIMIPLTKAQSRGDQYDNAEEFMKMWPEMGRVINEENLTIEMIQADLEKLLQQNSASSLSKENALQTIIALLTA